MSVNDSQTQSDSLGKEELVVSSSAIWRSSPTKPLARWEERLSVQHSVCEFVLQGLSGGRQREQAFAWGRRFSLKISIMMSTKGSGLSGGPE